MSGVEAGGPASPQAVAERQIILSRDFAAPRELVFQVWTDARHVAEWWGPDGFTTTDVQAMDVRPGGEWRFTMRAPDGTEFPNLMQFVEVDPPRRIVALHGSGEPNDQPFEFTVTFDDLGDRTRLTLTQQYPSAEVRDYVAREFHAVEMGNQTLARFAAYLATVAPD